VCKTHWHLEIWPGTLSLFGSRVSLPNICGCFCTTRWMVSQWIEFTTVPRTVSGVCVGLLGFGPQPPSVKVTPFRFPQGHPFFSWFPTSVLDTHLPGSHFGALSVWGKSPFPLLLRLLGFDAKV
jgi:hypothetical protein